MRDTGPRSETQMTIYNSVSANNGASASTGGVRASGAQTMIRIQNVTVTHNSFGLIVTGGGQIASWGNNYIAGNTLGDGLPTTTLPQQ